MLVVSKATHGVIPNLVGTTLEKALLKLRKLKLEPHVTLREREAGDGAGAEAGRWSRGRAGAARQARRGARCR